MEGGGGFQSGEHGSSLLKGEASGSAGSSIRNKAPLADLDHAFADANPLAPSRAVRGWAMDSEHR